MHHRLRRRKYRNLRFFSASGISKTRDCIDILLSGDSLADLKRDMHGVFLTEIWMEFMKESSIDMAKLEKKMGRDEAHGYLKKLYAPIHDFILLIPAAMMWSR